MDFDKDYYSILGCVPSADQAVIQAAYRALAKKYHPDANQGSNESREKFHDLSEAYEVLSDPIKRFYYDSMRFGASRRENAPGEHSSDEQKNGNAELQQRWEVIKEYFADIDLLAIRLGEISPNLRDIFQMTLLENKNFDQAGELADAIEEIYLTRYFGKKAELKDFARKLLRHKNFYRNADALRELNRTIVILGDNAPQEDIIKKFQEKYDLYWVFYQDGKKPYRSEELLNGKDWEASLPATRDSWSAIKGCSQKNGWRYDQDIFGIYHFVNTYSGERKVFNSPEDARIFMKISLEDLINERRRLFLQKLRR
jgi:curved DNA-binding protein CbpA